MNNIKSAKQLIQAIEAGHYYFAIGLNHNLISVKHITYNPRTKRFAVENRIDDSKQRLTEKQLFDEGLTNIGKAMKKNAFYIYKDL